MSRQNLSCMDPIRKIVNILEARERENERSACGVRRHLQAVWGLIPMCNCAILENKQISSCS